MEKKNPAASLTIGKWSLSIETRRIKVSSRREVRSSDSGDHGKGTLLGISDQSCRMTIHRIDLAHSNGDRLTMQVTAQGSRTSYTRTVAKGLLDIDLKPLKDKQESLTFKQASEYLGRILGLDAKVAAETILAPLPEETIEAVEIAEMVEA